jgi:hypothetical protein
VHHGRTRRIAGETVRSQGRRDDRSFTKLSDADWKKVTSAEKWSVGVTAHHVAGGHEGILGIVKTIASGQSIPNFTMAMLDEMNAKHAREQAGLGSIRETVGG